MNKFIILAIFFSVSIVSVGSYAEASTGSCVWAKDWAGTIMRIRQDGSPKKKLIDELDNLDWITRSMVMRYVDRAYERPLHNTYEAKQREVEEFKKNTYQHCRDLLSNKE